jgi:electron transport complex protein RnfA
MTIFTIFLSALFSGNILLSKFLDITLVNNLKKLDVALMVTFLIIDVAFVSSLLYYGLYAWVLLPLNLTFFGFVAMVIIIVIISEVESVLILKFFPTYYEKYSLYFPFVTMNALIPLVLMSITGPVLPPLWIVLSNAIALPLGFVMILLLMIVYRERFDSLKRIPRSFQGLAITLLTLALIAMALFGFGGLA